MTGISVPAATLKRKHNGDSKSPKKRRGVPTNIETIVDRTVVVAEPLEVTGISKGDVAETESQAEWVVSKPAGGRMVDVDPILTADQRFLIVPYTTSIQVYSTSDSLLVRRIPTTTSTRTANIVAFRQSLLEPSFLWVASANGHIQKINWTGDFEEPVISSTSTGSASASGLATIVVSVETSDKKQNQEVVLVSEIPDSVFATRISVYNSNLEFVKLLLELGSGVLRFHNFEVIAANGLIYGSIHKHLYVGSPQNLVIRKLEDLAYDFYTFTCDDIITSIDARIVAPSQSKKNTAKNHSTIDVAVGCARGPIYWYNDILARLRALDSNAKGACEAIQPKKMHWHRRAVHAVKWSRDGNYLISGGSEHTLILWQLDTNKQNFLPHLAGIVENIVVSASGAAYVIHLDDNSVMVLSSTDLEPTSYISGMQSGVYVTSVLKDHLVPRVDAEYVVNDINVIAALSPASPDKLYVCVGDGLFATRNGSKPYLQTIDLSNMRSVGKQAIARSSLIANNQTPAGGTIIDPEIKHMAFSCDGKWLATIDEWTPPEPNQIDEGLVIEEADLRQTRREIYLKIWDAESDATDNNETPADTQFALVSRINAPHESTRPEGVLDLASDPQNARFATLGCDGAVRVWKPRPRQRDGLAVKDERGKDLHTWVCDFGVTISYCLDNAMVSAEQQKPVSGRISFSDDGSCLIVAFGAGDEGNIYVIDAYSGEIRYSWDDLWHGSLHGLGLLGPYVIVLSHDLRVFDMVSDSLVYGLPILKTINFDTAVGAANLAIDRVSQHFAVSFRYMKGSELLIFSPESMQPLISHHFDSRIAALSASAEPHTSGFLIVDDEAQVFTMAQSANDTALVVAKSLDDMLLSATDQVAAAAGDIKIDDATDDEEEDEREAENEFGDVEMGDAMDVDDEKTSAHPTIIGQHQLADIFNAAPAYAMASMEDVFLKVAALLANNPSSS